MAPTRSSSCRPTSATETPSMRCSTPRRAGSVRWTLSCTPHPSWRTAGSRTSPGVFERILTTNVTGTANVARAALHTVDESHDAALVVVGSVLSKIAAPYLSPDGTSKWAIQGLVRTLRVEARVRPRVGISLVSPGGVDTPIYDQAGSCTGHPGHPPPVDPPEKVAGAIVAALERPGRDINVGFANPVMVAGFRLLPGVFDVLVGPLMRLAGQGKASIDAHTGNVVESTPEKEAVHGRWPHIWG